MRACAALQSFLWLRKIRRSRLAGESNVLAAFLHLTQRARLTAARS
jgi:hypothetical protein